MCAFCVLFGLALAASIFGSKEETYNLLYTFPFFTFHSNLSPTMSNIVFCRLKDL